MCGRFTLLAPAKALREEFPLFDFPDLQPRYNIAPTQTVPVVRILPQTGQPQVAALRWGLIPSWADDPAIGNRLINARAETAAEKPAFRAAFRQRRCLVLADGFYEWQKCGRSKQAFHIRRRDGRPFAFAGLWECWRKNGEPVETFTILTTEANDAIRPIHERMPVILTGPACENWLTPSGLPADRAAELLRPLPPHELEALPVGSWVNDPRHDDPDCLAAAGEPLPGSQA